MVPERGVIVLGIALLQPAGAADITRAEVTRTEQGGYEVSWGTTEPQVPVDVFVAPEPAANDGKLKRVVQHHSNGVSLLDPQASARPYFYIAAGRGSGTWVAERVLPLEGTRNFRDLGGYRTLDGKQVRWGKLYRSGMLSRLTDADYGYISNLHIALIHDLRSTGERAVEPTRYDRFEGARYWARDYAVEGDLSQLFSSHSVTADEVRRSMVDMYRRLPYEQAAALSALLRSVAAGQLPLAFHCTAGKDRTGVAAALILTVLNVPRETIVQDYELTEKVDDFGWLKPALEGTAVNGVMAKISPDAARALLRSDRKYIEAMFDAVERKDGSVDAYLRQVLQLTEKELQAIRSNMRVQ